MIRLMVGLLMAMGATGGVEFAETCSDALISMGLAFVGLFIMYSGAMDLAYKEKVQ